MLHWPFHILGMTAYYKVGSQSNVVYKTAFLTALYFNCIFRQQRDCFYREPLSYFFVSGVQLPVPLQNTVTWLYRASLNSAACKLAFLLNA
jgi:hypothetical protein